MIGFPITCPAFEATNTIPIGSIDLIVSPSPALIGLPPSDLFSLSFLLVY